MKQRITYIIRNPSDFHPDKLNASKNSFSVNNLNAVKEQSVTLGPKEIPSELWRVLRNCHELHVRWSTAQIYDDYAPFVSRTAPGIHVFFTPLEGRSAKRLCDLIKDSFGANVKCSNVKDAFTTPPILSERFSSSAARQFYHFTPSLLDLSLFVQHSLCGSEQYACQLVAHDLKKADTFDLDFDAISQTLVAKAMFTQANGDDGTWYEETVKGKSEGETLEVGVLMQENADEEEDLRFSGFLTQVGKDDQPKPTLFSTASRHHKLPPSHSLSYSAFFNTPTGIHPTLALDFSSSAPEPPAAGCALHAYFTLPSTLFFDKYPFSDPLFLASHNLRKMHALSGATDLEAPEWTVLTWGSAALFELALPSSSSSSSSSPSASSASADNSPERRYKATFPLHLRYLPPFNASTILTPVPWPVVFWACPAQKGSKFHTSPFDRRNLGYDGLFGSNTVFYHVPPPSIAASGIGAAGAAGAAGAGFGRGISRTVSTISVPVLDLQQASNVEWGTVVTILAGTVWVLYVLARGVWRHGYEAKSLAESS